MPLTELQRQRRTARIGASDMPVIMGLINGKSAADTYWAKVNNLEDFDAGKAASAGNFFEDGLLRYAADALGDRRIVRNQYRVRGIFHATHDALFPDFPKEALEAKMTGWFNPTFDPNEWGEYMSDDVPLRVLIQAQQQCYVSDLDLVYAPALISGRGPQLYRIERRDDIIENIVETGEWFWEFVEAGEPPPDLIPNIETLKRVERVAGESAILPTEEVMELARLQQVKGAAEKDYKAQQTRVLHLLGEAEEGWAEDGSGFGVTYYEKAGRRNCDLDRLLAEFPSAYNACVSQKPSRSLLVKKPKKEKVAN